MAAKRKFTRRVGTNPVTKVTDLRGIVSIRVYLRKMGTSDAMKGNVTRFFSIDKATVSEVANAIEKSLF